MNRITNEQREGIVRRAIADRDACLAGQPTVLERIRAGIAADRCDGDTEYAAGVNAACRNHLALIDNVIATSGVSVAHDQTFPPSHADAESPARGGRQG